MIADGLTLAAGSGLGIQMLDADRRGPAFPPSAVANELWELTAPLGNQPAGIYEYFTSWTLRSPQYSVLSYDLSGTVFGSPNPGARVMFFVAPRSFTLQGSLSGAIAKALSPSTSLQEFSIVHMHNGVSDFVGVIRFTDGNDTGEFVPNSPSDIKVLRGDALIVLAPDSVDPALTDISFTLCGFISA